MSTIQMLAVTLVENIGKKEKNLHGENLFMT